MENEPFADKRDANYIKLTSNSSFFEMCGKKNIKLDLLIPQTILFEKSNPKSWFFNSRQAKGQKVLKKNQDKLNLLEAAKSLSGIKVSDDLRLDNVQGLYEQGKNSRQFNNPTPIVFVKMLGNQKKSLSCSEFMKLLVDGKDIASFIYVQNFIKNETKANELYYIEYRKDVENMPVIYKFFKKTVTKHFPQKHQIINPDELNPFQPIMKVTSQNKNVAGEQEQFKQAFFKCFDGPMNLKFQQKTLQIVEFIEAAFNIKVKKVVIKYLVDSDQTIYFNGLKELFIWIHPQAPYDLKQMNDELSQSQNRVFDQFMSLCKLLKTPHKANMVMYPKQIVENQKKLSKTLFKNLILEKCQGDFCQYILTERNKGPLQIRKGINEKYKSAFNTSASVDTLENIATHLPHEISQQLILRTRESSDDIIKLFQKNKIQLKNIGQDESQKLDIDLEFPFKNIRQDVYNLENLYRKVKICKTCFIIYSMIAKEFDLNLKKDLKIKSWIALPKIQTFEDQGKEKKVSMNSIKEIKGDDEYRSEEDEQENPQPKLEAAIMQRAQSEQKFRLNRRANEKKPIKIFLVPKEIHEQQFKRASTTQFAPRSSKASQQMEVNRLALGYMNYQQLDSYKNNISDLENIGKKEPAKRQSFLEELNQNLVAHLALERIEPTRKIDSNANENVHQVKLMEDLKMMAKKISNDSEIRQTHQHYYQLKIDDGCQLEHLFTTSFFYYHANFAHLRRVHKFRLSTPLQPITDELKFDKLKPLTLEFVCQMMNYPQPTIIIPELKFHVYDERTAVAYALLQSRSTIAKNRNKYNSKATQSGVELVIFLQDMFESMHEYYGMMIDHLKKSSNRKILMINLPGQSYSIYSTFVTYNSLIFSEILDQLLYVLDEEQYIDLQRDTIKLVGIGSGGYVLQTFVCEAFGHIPFINSITLVNSFSKVDEQFSHLLQQAAKILAGHPKAMPELSYEYISTLVNTKPLTADSLNLLMTQNPIQVNGRIQQIHALLNSSKLIDRFERILIAVQVYHSLKNCMINIQEADCLSQFVQDEASDINNPVLSKKLAHSKRTAEYFDGGHNILLENPRYLNVILNRVMQ